MGNCIPKRKLQWLISNKDSLLDEDCLDPEPYHIAPSKQPSVEIPLVCSEMSASLIETDRRATEIIHQLG